MMKSIVKEIIKYKEEISVITSLLICMATIVATIVNANLVSNQNEIYKEQMELQKKQNQPVFSISSKYEQDLNDGKYGTELLIIRNVGHIIPQPCDIKTNVLFKITKTNGFEQNSLYFPISHYFNYFTTDNIGDNEIYSAIGKGNNRVFSDIYSAAIEASNVEKDFSYYIEKQILIKIKYCDIYDKEHTLYFMDQMSIPEETYDNVISKSNNPNCLKNLRNISFPIMKCMVDELDEKQK